MLFGFVEVVMVVVVVVIVVVVVVIVVVVFCNYKANNDTTQKI